MMNRLQITIIVFLIMGLHACCIPIWAQTANKVDGTVVAADNGSPLPGVNIVVKGTSAGTTSDSDGKFSLNVSNADVLVFSFIGYETQEVAVGTATQLDIRLDPDVETLSEVVVVGYGETKKESLTSAISAVKGKELLKSPQTNLSGSFAGRVSGVVANTSSGEPGFDNARLYIRGQSTTGKNDPLIVIDGVANRIGGLDRLDH